MTTTTTTPPTIEPIPGTSNVRLRWLGFEQNGHDARMYADFDPCPVRGLSARESAADWARRVLGVEAEQEAAKG